MHVSSRASMSASLPAPYPRTCTSQCHSSHFHRSGGIQEIEVATAGESPARVLLGTSLEGTRWQAPQQTKDRRHHESSTGS